MLGAGTGLKENVLLGISWFDRLHSHGAQPVHSIARGLTQESSYKFEGLNVSISREARIGRSGDSDCERRVSPLPRDQRRRLYRQSLSRNAASATAAARASGTTTILSICLLCCVKTAIDGRY